MKIAHVSAHYRPIIGGQEVYISNLIKVCQSSGHQSLVYQVGRGEKGPDTVCLPRLRYLARFIPALDRKWLNLMVSTFRPKGLFGADVIIAHYAFHAPPLIEVRKKTIILSHGVEWRVTNQESADRAAEENAKRCLGEYVHVVNDTHYLRHLGHDVPAAQGFFREVIPGTWFIPNCVDSEHFRPGAGLPEFQNRKMILVPRQMVEDRGIHLAIEAFSKIADEFPDYEMCLLGKRHKGAARYIQRLDQMIIDYGLQNRVYFRDPVPNAEMPVWYNSAEVTLIPTTAREGTSLSALESMACAIPTISTNVAGLADLPTVQCDPNADAIAATIKSTLAEIRTIGNSQRKVVSETFNMKNWSEGWLRVIEAAGSRS